MAGELLDLIGTIAVVTGAGTGVGRATAIALGECGAVVGLIGRRPGPLRATYDAVKAAGGHPIFAPADVADDLAVDMAVRSIVDQTGGIDVLVCAAGVGLYGAVDSYPLADWNTTLATNLTGVFLTCRAVLPHMVDENGSGGTIIAIGSGAGKQGYANLAAYSASKFGLIGFMQSLAAEVGERGIKVSTILPGSILTEFGGRSIDEKLRQRAEGRKFLDADDVAQAIVALLMQSDRAWTQELNLWPF